MNNFFFLSLVGNFFESIKLTSATTGVLIMLAIKQGKGWDL